MQVVPVVVVASIWFIWHLLFRLGTMPPGEDPAGAFSASAMLLVVVSASYVVFALLGYRVRGDEVEKVPSWLAVLVVSLVTVLGIVGLILLAGR